MAAAGRQRIVVGVDGSEGAGRALAWAVAEARCRDALLEIVTGWSYEPPDTLGEFSGRAQGTIDQALAHARELDPQVEAKGTVVHVGAAEALVGESQGADLLVVGSRGRGGFAGLVLGSVSQQCALHASCPVVIVPHAARS